MATPIRIATVLAAAAALLLALGGPGRRARRCGHEREALLLGQGQTALAGTPADPLANDLIYHGGNAGAGAIGVEQKPAVYLIYWGQEWADGFQTSDTDGKLYSSKTLQNYVNSFFGSVGGSKWAGVQTQYCNVVLAGSTSCLGGAGFVTNPKNQLKGVWTDPTPVPDDIIAPVSPRTSSTTRSPPRRRGPPGTSATTRRPPTSSSRRRARSRPASRCTAATTRRPRRSTGSATRTASSTRSSRGRTRTGPESARAAACTTSTRRSNAFGNGIFDGWSIVTGHEYAEAVTDPDNFATWQDGWLDAQGSENGDKCAWTDTQNITLGSHAFAVQPLWSNEAFDATGNGCVVSR